VARCSTASEIGSLREKRATMPHMLMCSLFQA
jgi:hypothetical protein